MPNKLTDTIVENLPTPENGNRITYDKEIKGFGCRVTAGGARSFILNYRTRKGRQRRYTIGSYPDWKTAAARREAGDLKKRIDVGEDPMADVEADRNAKTIGDLCDRFIAERLPDTPEGEKLAAKGKSSLRASTQRDYAALIRNRIRPALKHIAVADVTFSDIEDLHRKITNDGAPYMANRSLALLSKMMGLAVKWGYRKDNPVKGIERNQEEKRHRYLSAAELVKLTKALISAEDQQAANIIRLLLLTGARRGEVLSMRWDNLDLTQGVWTKPGATTKQKTEHRVPLSAPARQLLAELHENAKPGGEYVFPGRGAPHRIEIKDAWRDICIAAEIVKQQVVKDNKEKERIVLVPTARMHDLRHTYASVLASAGLSLPIIGALLGHTQPATTQRYAHLFDDPLRAATDRAGAIITAERSGDVVPLKGEA